MSETATTTTAPKHYYGWKPQLPDFRDHYLLLARPGAGVPSHIDLRPLDCPIKDQGQLGSCTANAIAGAIEFALGGPKAQAISRLFIYYNERAAEGTVKVDAGAVIRDGFKTISKLGACPESEWPYNVAKFATKPTATCYKDALKHVATGYQSLGQSLANLKACLAAGRPFVNGFSLYASFESDAVAATGVVPMPAKTEQLLGGHAVKCVGYDDEKEVFIYANSWGTGWGDKGYFYMPYAYVGNPQLASDFWTIQAES